MATQQGTVLIVEDFLLMRQIIKGFLRRMGYAHILEAEQGSEALTRLRQQPIDLVLADWDLPQMDGFALLTAMRADAQRRTVPVVMITAEAARDKVMAAIQDGVPVGPVRLIACAAAVESEMRTRYPGVPCMRRLR